ncbi:poly-gamma-glutamate hydrolase family protein [Staphylococcus saprophyticus]|uniref:poly-gamma-glutamate hydrolase family protein n=1 Tax=Staphylococcus saprophyticus TaxID=29385 RepID=UPI0022EABEA1|nr:poly-gamma-glutamate hydrolase family protein [Staphylococcus saprophyticus]
MADTYKSMTELIRKHDKTSDYMFEVGYRNSDTLITAIHGGGIEAGTTELALLTSELSNSNYFSFKGLKAYGNTELHVTSTNYDNPLLLTLNQNADKTIAIHGYSGTEKNTFIGGNDKQLVTLITQYLKEKGFYVEIAPTRIGGSKESNITNKNKRGVGVQLELSTSLRKALFEGSDFSKKNRESRSNWSEAMYDYANAICKAIQDVQ